MTNLSAGIALREPSKISLRMGKCSIKESFVRITNDEGHDLRHAHQPVRKGNIFNKDPLRERKLLMHRYGDQQAEGKRSRKRIHAGPASGVLFKEVS